MWNNNLRTLKVHFEPGRRPVTVKLVTSHSMWWMFPSFHSMFFLKSQWYIVLQYSLDVTIINKQKLVLFFNNNVFANDQVFLHCARLYVWALIKQQQYYSVWGSNRQNVTRTRISITLIKLLAGIIKLKYCHVYWVLILTVTSFVSPSGFY